MAFGIGRIVKAVEDLSVRITGISTDLNTAVTQSGADLGRDLTEIRRISEANSREIAAVRREIAELCALVESRCTGTADVRAAAGGPAAQPGTGSESAPFDDALHPADHDPHDDLHHDPHHDLLAHAAGVANAELVCHADTWAFIAEQAIGGEHFRMPVGRTADTCDGTVAVKFSGRTLIAIADALWEVTQSAGASPGTHHLAAQTYNRLHAAVVGTVPDPAGSADVAGGVVRVVIDDRSSGLPDADTHGSAHRLSCAAG